MNGVAATAQEQTSQCYLTHSSGLEELLQKVLSWKVTELIKNVEIDNSTEITDASVGGSIYIYIYIWMRCGFYRSGLVMVLFT